MLPDLLHEAARRFGPRPAYVEDGSTVSYADLKGLADRVAAGLAIRGVREGDVVALVLPTGIEYPVCYLACARLGAITAGVNPRLAPVEQARLLDVVAPALVVARDAPPAARPTVVLPALASPLARLRALEAQVEAPPPPAPDPDRVVAVVFTSGTTGTPKGAVFAERQLAAVRDIEVGDRWGQGGPSVSATSLAHLGFMTKIASSMQSGTTSHLISRWRPGDALRLASAAQVATLAGVPTQLALMLEQPVLAELDMSTLRQVLIGGGPATPALVRRARQRLGVPVVVRYSCTEAGIGCGTAYDDPPEDAERSVGRPQRGVALSIRSDGGSQVPVGDVGEVCLRSPAQMVGYWRNASATTAATTEDGFVRTGDLGRVDERGRLQLVGRRSEMYVRGGYNVFPVAVEAVLASHPEVAAVAVVPRSDELWGEIGVAVVVPAGRPPALDELREHGAHRLARHELPEALQLVDALPLTAGDKVDRRALLDLVSDGHVR